MKRGASSTGNGIIPPQTKDDVFRPGFVGNMLIGGVGALVSWGLYTGSAYVLIGGTFGG